MRQSALPEHMVRTLAVGYPSGAVLPPPAHDWAQLVFASEGVMISQTEDGTWVVPSHRAVWIPAGVRHSVAMSGWVSMRTLYIAPQLVAALPKRCGVIGVSPLLRHLILHVVAQGSLRRSVPEHRRLVAFLLDQLRVVPAVPLELAMPRDARAVRVATQLRESPGENAPINR